MRTRVTTAIVSLVATSALAQAPAVPGVQACRPDGSAPPGVECRTAAAPAADRKWHIDASLSNVFDGNINHDPEPVRSYGVAPGASVRYLSGDDEAFAFEYAIASNTFSGTDEWDRISQGVMVATSMRPAKRLRLETSGSATWKGSSEDRELANEYAVAQRATVKLSSVWRVSIFGAARYKQYPDEPGTSGPSPYAGVKTDVRLGGDTRLAFGYKYQIRHSQDVRDRYRRQTYALELSGQGFQRRDRFEIGAEYRPQEYDRLIKTSEGLQPRADRRMVVAGSYDRSLGTRVGVSWFAGLERRTSNDPDKHFVAPSFGMSIRYTLY